MKEEVELWYKFLMNHEFAFNRFKIVDRYIADFYCDKAKLAIELCDDTSEDYDNKFAKTKLMESMGIKLLFIEKRLILDDFPQVCRMIDHFVEERTK